MFTLYSAECVGNPANCHYPNRFSVTDAASLRAAVCRDYVCAAYRNNTRGNAAFLGSDCLPVDCDNDHSDVPEEWVTPKDVAKAFPNVAFAVHYSRSHMKDKRGRSARPRFHVLFPIEYMEDASIYAETKRRVNALFPYFDKKALDAARFFFGTKEAEVDLFEGSSNLTDFLRSDEEFDADLTQPAHGYVPIMEGSRNATLSRFAGRVLKKYGNSDKAYECFLEEAQKCVPPLQDQELRSIWRSALKFCERVTSQADYVPPAHYEEKHSYKPRDYSDVGQAEVLAQYYKKELRYSPATSFLRYKGYYWQETDSGAQEIAHDLTRLQMTEANAEMETAEKHLKQNGTEVYLTGMTRAKAESLMSEAQKKVYQEYMDAQTYKKFAVERRNSLSVTATLKEVKPMIEIDPRELDADAFLLNAPDATYDLRMGMAGAREHSPQDHITKITSVSPGKKGEEIWQAFLEKVFCEDRELMDYVQQICGLAAIGKVYVEALVIAYGSGRNGKSTFWNTVSRVLGLYSGKISADTLTVNCRRNIKPELAEAKGKRLLIASEMQEGARLNDSMVKQLCSTDDVFAEKKYKDPFFFTPCHTLVLYTNHLPKIGSLDPGIWRRMIVIPFNAVIEGDSDIKNYGDYLFENAGPSILAWVIEGAQRMIERQYKIPVPECVSRAIGEYRESNDWLAHFLENSCERGEDYRSGAMELYQAYRAYCLTINEYVRTPADFCAAMEMAGFTKEMIKKKYYYFDIRISTNDLSEIKEYV